MVKRKVATITIVFLGFLSVFLLFNGSAFAKERIVQFDNPGCE